MKHLTALLPLLPLLSLVSAQECDSKVTVTVTSTTTIAANLTSTSTPTSPPGAYGFPITNATTSSTSTLSSATSSSTPSTGLNAFTLMAIRSGSPIHFLSVNASGLGLWLGKETATYCPDSVPCAHFASNVTAFYAGGNALDVTVPGGQQVYAAPAGTPSSANSSLAPGQLAYTQAHSASISPNATIGGGNQTAPGAGQQYGYWSWTAGGATSLFACPADGSDASKPSQSAIKGPWRVVADVDGVDVSKCLGFKAAAVPYKGVAAWQYT